jgi:hypothetical protein
MDEFAELARKVVAQFGDEDLAKVLERLGAHGVAADLKNLIFAAVPVAGCRWPLRSVIGSTIRSGGSGRWPMHSRLPSDHTRAWGSRADT